MHADHYERFVEDRMRELVQLFTGRSDASQLSNFWKTRGGGVKPPMTSLRDVDVAGVISGLHTIRIAAGASSLKPYVMLCA